MRKNDDYARAAARSALDGSRSIADAGGRAVGRATTEGRDGGARFLPGQPVMWGRRLAAQTEKNNMSP